MDAAGKLQQEVGGVVGSKAQRIKSLTKHVERQGMLNCMGRGLLRSFRGGEFRRRFFHCWKSAWA